MIIIYLVSIEWIYRKLQKDNRNFEKKNPSAKSFAIQMRIPKQVWEAFKRSHDETPDESLSNLQQFRDLLIEQLTM